MVKGDLPTVTSELERRYDSLASLDPVLADLVEEYGRPDPFEWFDGGRTGSGRFAYRTYAATLLWRSLWPVEEPFTGPRLESGHFATEDRLDEIAGGTKEFYDTDVR